MKTSVTHVRKEKSFASFTLFRQRALRSSERIFIEQLQPVAFVYTTLVCIGIVGSVVGVT